MSIDSVFNEVAASKKYAYICSQLLQRVVAEEHSKYQRDKERVKAVKNRLHQICGAYAAGDCHRDAGRLLDSFESSADASLCDLSLQLMRLHSSTNERISIVSEFYSFIFDAVGKIDSVLDLGCGFNPVCLPFMPGVERYYAYDIDARTSHVLNRYFHLAGFPPLAGECDVITATPDEQVDVAFLFKLLPLLDSQSRGRSDELLCQLSAKFIVVSFPTRSLGGQRKGMEGSYTESFERRINGAFSIVAREVFGNELVYIISRFAANAAM